MNLLLNDVETQNYEKETENEYKDVQFTGRKTHFI